MIGRMREPETPSHRPCFMFLNLAIGDRTERIPTRLFSPAGMKLTPYRFIYIGFNNPKKSGTDGMDAKKTEYKTWAGFTSNAHYSSGLQL